MNIIQRIQNLAIAAVMTVAALFIIPTPEIGIQIAAMIISIALGVVGLRFLIYYFSMARYSVGGKIMLYIGMIVLDVGLLILSILTDNPKLLMYFLQGFFGFYGVIDIIRGVQAKKSGAPLWKINMITGSINITIMVLAFVSVHIYSSEILMDYIFSGGLLYMAAMRIIAAFRKTAVVYIQ